MIKVYFRDKHSYYNMRKTTLIVLLGLWAPFLAQAQEAGTSCNDKTVHAELVIMNKSVEQTGFSLVQFHTLSLPAGNYVPLYVSMEAGKMYQINFVGSKDAKNYTLVLIDKDKKKLIDKKKEPNAHQFTQSFTAPYTGTYALILSQKVKGESSSCAGVSVLKAAATVGQ